MKIHEIFDDEYICINAAIIVVMMVIVAVILIAVSYL